MILKLIVTFEGEGVGKWPHDSAVRAVVAAAMLGCVRPGLSRRNRVDFSSASREVSLIRTGGFSQLSFGHASLR